MLGEENRWTLSGSLYLVLQIDTIMAKTAEGLRILDCLKKGLL